MNICFEAVKNDTLDNFLDNWVNPTNPMTMATNSTFVEFKVHRRDNLVIISQQNIYDVIAKFLVYTGAGLSLMSVLISMMLNHGTYFSTWGIIGLGIVFVGTLWLSPHFRYMLIRMKLRMLGYKEKITYVSTSYALSKVLYEEE